MKIIILLNKENEIREMCQQYSPIYDYAERDKINSCNDSVHEKELEGIPIIMKRCGTNFYEEHVIRKMELPNPKKYWGDILISQKKF